MPIPSEGGASVDHQIPAGIGQRPDVHAEGDGFTVFWIVMISVSILTGWISSVTYVSASGRGLSFAIGSAWQAARVEVEQARPRRSKKKRRVSEGGRRPHHRGDRPVPARVSQRSTVNPAAGSTNGDIAELLWSGAEDEQDIAVSAGVGGLCRALLAEGASGVVSAGRSATAARRRGAMGRRQDP